MIPAQASEGLYLQKLAVVLKIEMGSGLTPDHNHSCPADVQVERWERG